MYKLKLYYDGMYVRTIKKNIPTYYAARKLKKYHMEKELKKHYAEDTFNSCPTSIKISKEK